MSSELERETVERAAVMRNGVVWDVPRPGRHAQAIRAACDALLTHELGPHEQGFVTSTGRFVTRYQAARIAFRAGQTKDLVRRVFTSEELW